jgi:hypothetical protein
MKTRAQQRAEVEAKLMSAVNLQAHLTNLIHAIIVGKRTDLLAEFQQFVQYAPPEMKDTLWQTLQVKMVLAEAQDLAKKLSREEAEKGLEEILGISNKETP